MTPIINYLKETRRELAHVSWPTQNQTIIYTVLVALLSVGIALYLGALDMLFTMGLGRIVTNTETRAAQSEGVTPLATSSVATSTAATSSEPDFTVPSDASSTTN